jgi:hypothetical protein
MKGRRLEPTDVCGCSKTFKRSQSFCRALGQRKTMMGAHCTSLRGVTQGFRMKSALQIQLHQFTLSRSDQNDGPGRLSEANPDLLPSVRAEKRISCEQCEWTSRRCTAASSPQSTFLIQSKLNGLFRPDQKPNHISTQTNCPESDHFP